MKKVITRFAPSPTGDIHIGNIRTALFAYLYAKRNKGIFFVRIDDTDKNRNSKESVKKIINILNWLELKSDLNVVFQSKRYVRYKSILKKLIHQGDVYKCFCSKKRLDKLKEKQIISKEKVKYDGFCKKNKNINSLNRYVLRYNNKSCKNIFFKDLVKGRISISNDEIDDFIIAKNNFIPTYNFASVVDDIDFNVTHVIRGEDHLSNTLKQILVFRMLSFFMPKFIHLPMLLNEQKQVLSKRTSISSVEYYKKNGFLPKAILNYLLKLGWSYKDKEIFSYSDMIKLFNLRNINKSNCIINNDKLIWLNKYYIKISSVREIFFYLLPVEKKIVPEAKVKPILKNLIIFYKKKAKTLNDFILDNIFLYKENQNINIYLLKQYLSDKIIKVLINLYNKFKNPSFLWCKDGIKIEICYEIKLNNILLSKIAIPLRIIITGCNIPSPIYDLIFICGRILILKRIKNIIKDNIFK